MKSRTNAHQELMRQQIIDEEHCNNGQTQHENTSPALHQINQSGPRSANILSAKNITQKSLITLDGQINKRQKSPIILHMSDNNHSKMESFSPTKSSMDASFSNLGNDDVSDWNQLEPSITTTSIWHDFQDEITRHQQEAIVESYMETGTEENDSLEDDQSISSTKPSTSCPANITHPILLFPGQTVKFSQNVSTGHKSIAPVSVMDDQKTPWMRDRNKKDNHNRVERKRRDYINNHIQELGQLLPERIFVSTESKKNKGGILKTSVIYIQELQHMATCVPQLQKEAQISEHIISSNFKRIQYLEGLLSENGINYDEADNDKVTLQDWFNIHQSNSHLLQNVNSIKSSWSVDNDNEEKLPGCGDNYEDLIVKSENMSDENIHNFSTYL